MPKRTPKNPTKKRITKKQQMRLDQIRAKHIETREKNKEKTKELLQSIRSSYGRYREMKKDLRDLKELVEDQRKRILDFHNSVDDVVKELIILNPGGCDRCGLLDGHKPYDCTGFTDSEAEPCCSESECDSSDCDEYTYVLRWDKEPTEEYMKHLNEKLSGSFWNQLSGSD